MSTGGSCSKETNPSPSESRLWISLEWCFSLIVIAGLIHISYFFVVRGYLPDPFLSDPGDTFMDWYYPAFWSHHRGAYDVFFSVYPPLSFLFQKILGISSCYKSAIVARSCDWLGEATLIIAFILNICLSYLSFRNCKISTAIPRAIGTALGMPMLFALERGNMIIPCFTFFILAYGNIKIGKLVRIISSAVTVNLKPYLIIMGIGFVIRRDWRRAEYFGIFIASIYLVSYLIFLDGDPFQIIRSMIGFSTGSAVSISLKSLLFTTSFSPLLYYVRHIPLLILFGSKPVDFINFWLPILMNASMVGTAACVIIALFKPKILSANHIFILLMSCYSVIGGPGGYTLGFLIFLIFLREWRGLAGRIVVLMSYAWCLPWDYTIQLLYRRHMTSFLSGRMVLQDVTVPAGDFWRPAAMLMLDYAIIVVTLCELHRSQPKS